MKKKIIFSLLLVFFIAVQCWFSYIVLRYPYLGINLTKNSQNEWIVFKFDPETDRATLTNLQVGDRVLKIDGQDPEDNLSVKRWRTIEQADTIEVMHDGVQVLIDTKNIRNTINTQTLPVFAEVIALIMAALLYFKLGYTPSARFLSLVFFTIGVAFMSVGASARGDALGKFMIINSVLLTPIVFLHFLLVFLKEKGRIALQYKYLRYLYGIAAVHFVLFLGYFHLTTTYHLYKYSAWISLPYFIFGIFLNFTVLLYLYMKHRKELSFLSTVIKTIWASLIISFTPIAFLSFIPHLLFHEELISSLKTAWFILFLPLSFTYLMATEKLYDIPGVVRRILFTALIAAIPSGIVVVMAAVIFPSAAYPDRLATLFILTEALFTYVLLSLEYIITKLSKYMFPRKYQLQKALGKIASDLVSVSSFRQMKEIVLVDIVKALQVHGGAIVFQFADNELETITAGEIDVKEVEDHIREGKMSCSCCTVYAINRHEEYSSFLVVTEKKTKTRLVMEEREWLNLIITYLSVSLENIYLIRKLLTKLHEFAAQELDEPLSGDFAWLRKSMFELLEKERQRIANDLHDTTMQDLMFLKRKLVNLMEKYTTTEEDDKKLQGLLDYIEMINTNLRQSCFELYPHLLRVTGLVDTIEKIVDIESASVPFEIIFRPVNTSDIEGLDMDQKRHVFRIVQELLNNAKKHSKATEVTIELTAKDSIITLSYRDNGIGFDKLPRPILGRSGVGMLQLKSRVLDLHGKLDIKSKRGGGLRLKISFPLREIQTA